MCGIVGILGNVSGFVVDEALGQIAHRGPDGAAIIVWSDFVLSACRLAIVDPQPRSNQPMTIRARETIGVLNGEIYNFLDLASVRRLKRKLKTESDTEVALRLLSEDGLSAACLFNGMFAIALYDAKLKRLLLVRDPFGIKPLFYHIAKGGVAFASELKAFLPWMRTQGYRLRIFKTGYDRYNCQNPETDFPEILELSPGHALEVQLFSEGVISNDIHYTHILEKRNTPPARNRKKDEDYASQITSILEKAISNYLPAGLRTGLFLSGGIDSGLLLSYLHNILPPDSLVAYTVGAVNGGSNNEFPQARQFVENYKHLCYKEITVNQERFLELLIDTIYALEDFNPVNVETGILTMALCSEAQKDGIRVVLVGEGADELFFGYPNFYDDKEGQSPDYHRMESRRITYLSSLYRNHLRRHDRCGMHYGIEIRVPYLEHELVQSVLNTPIDIVAETGFTQGREG
jgi:asparagine synthase (glutamine-hydrolysing)